MFTLAGTVFGTLHKGSRFFKLAAYLFEWSVKGSAEREKYVRSHQDFEVPSFFSFQTILDGFVQLRTGFRHSGQGEHGKDLFQNNDSIVDPHELPGLYAIQKRLLSQTDEYLQGTKMFSCSPWQVSGATFSEHF
jgi:hypothetical protein